MPVKGQTLSCNKTKVYSGYRVNMSVTFRIGDLAKQADVKVVTIRYYEQAGLLPACERTPVTIACTLKSTCNA